MALTVAMFVAFSTADARELTAKFLNGKAPLHSPVATSEFSVAGQLRPAQHRFEGRLRLSRQTTLGDMRVLKDDYGTAKASAGKIRHLPQFDFEFVQQGDALIPVQRGSQRNSNRYWEYILEPGRVWSESGDGGLSRAALPFSLQERNANCTHNGLLTFLFDDRGTVSRAAYQIGSETCAYFKADLWGVLPAQYVPHPVSDRPRIIADYAREVTARLPVKAIETLATDFPGANPDRFGSSDEVAAQDMTAFGLVIDGTHYVGGCSTRHGPYPFCEVLDLPSYSLAKSLFAGLVALRLEKLYPGTLRQKIRDYVPACTNSERWGEVTFEHALDMATGNFTSSVFDVDEGSAATVRFFVAEDHALKIDLACRHHPHRAAAGTTWVYHTTDTYVLGTALNAFVKERFGQDRDVYTDVLVHPLWRKLGLSAVVDTTRRTRDTRAQPFTGFGLTLHRNDIARIAQFLNSGHGKLSGEEFFDPSAFAAAMQRDPADRGLTALDTRFRYNNGFWAHDVSKYLGCKSPTWVPYMTGFGGITVLLLPNNTIYYYFSDGGAFKWSQAASESNRIRNFCKATP